MYIGVLQGATVLHDMLTAPCRNAQVPLPPQPIPQPNAEIKVWYEWKAALGQLLAYNVASRKEELQVYLFGKYSESRKSSY
jgi:hypothetical protein